MILTIDTYLNDNPCIGVCSINLKYFGIKDCYFDPVFMPVGPYDKIQVCNIIEPGYVIENVLGIQRIWLSQKFPLALPSLAK